MERRAMKRQARMLLKTQGTKFFKLNLLSIILNIIYFTSINYSAYYMAGLYTPNELSKLVASGQLINSRQMVFIMGFQLFATMIKVGVQYSMLDFLSETGDKNLERPFSDAIQVFSAKYFSAVILMGLLSSMLVQYATYIFIIPGVYLYLLFSQIFFVFKSGNSNGKNLGIINTFTKSGSLINGFKIQYLLLDISFLGWDILNSLTSGLLSVWLLQYKNMTYTLFYQNLIRTKKGEL